MDIQEFYKQFLKSRKICTDSRAIVEGSMFFALKGENFNGNRFALEALSKGCSLVVVDEDMEEKDDRIIQVPDVLLFLQKLANYHRIQFDIPVLAITGTNGKTTSKELINAVLSQKYEVVATRGNFNNHIGVPLTLLDISDNTQIAIIEMGANHVGEIEDLCNIANPNLGIITNIGNAHLEGFGSPALVIKAKKELYDFLKKRRAQVFVNSDDVLLTKLSGNLTTTTYGHSSDSDVQGKVMDEIFCTVQWSIADDLRKLHNVRTKLVGSYNFPNIMAAICTGHHFEVETEAINAALESYVPGINRSQYLETDRNKVILDAYNANPDSMKAAIGNFKEIKAEQKVIILGDMFELGEYSASAHEEIVLVLSSTDFYKVYLLGPEFAGAAIDTSIKVFQDMKMLIEELQKNPIEDSLILLKGSRGMRLERLIDFL